MLLHLIVIGYFGDTVPAPIPITPPVRRIRTGPIYMGLARHPGGSLPRSPVRALPRRH